MLVRYLTQTKSVIRPTNNEQPDKFPGYQLLVILQSDNDIQFLKCTATN